MMNAAVYNRLIQVAKARQLIPFSDVCRIADLSLDTEDDTKIAGLVLDKIADNETAAGRPLLPVVVVGPNNMPGAGLFKYAKRKKLQKTDDLTYFATELKRVYDYWSQPGAGGVGIT